MDVTRRGFLKATGIGATISLGFDVSRAKAEMRDHSAGTDASALSARTRAWPSGCSSTRCFHSNSL